MGGHIILLLVRKSRNVRLIIDADKRAALIISRHIVTSRQVFSIQTSRLADIFIETLKWVRNDDRTVGATIEQFAGREATTPFLEDRCPLVHRCRGRGKCEVK